MTLLLQKTLYFLEPRAAAPVVTTTLGPDSCPCPRPKKVVNWSPMGVCLCSWRLELGFGTEDSVRTHCPESSLPHYLVAKTLCPILHSFFYELSKPFRFHMVVLPATFGPFGDGNPPPPLSLDRHGSLFVLSQRKATVQIPPVYEVSGVATADEEAMEKSRGGFGVEEATGPVGTVSVGGEGHGRRFGVSTHHECGVRWSRESVPRE